MSRKKLKKFKILENIVAGEGYSSLHPLMYSKGANSLYSLVFVIDIVGMAVSMGCPAVIMHVLVNEIYL